MDFEPTELQTELVNAIAAFCEGRWPLEVVRAQGAASLAGADGSAADSTADSTAESTAAASAPSVDRARWKDLADTGVFSLRLSEAKGGVGLRLADAALVFEQLGRALIPGPLVATHLAAGIVEGADTGDTVVGLVEANGAGPWFVEHLAGLDALLVLDDHGVRVVDPRDVVGARVGRPLDAWTPMTEVGVLPVGTRIGDSVMAEHMRADGIVLTAAMLVGLAGAALDTATAYAKVREQFGRPIGSFQAVKHILADMFARYEVARAATHSAAVLADQPEVSDPVRARRGAKLLASDAAILNGKAGIQVHGGMGFTWEVDAHLYLKRAWVLETHFGSSDEHAEALPALL